jgi:hypothetical protein
VAGSTTRREKRLWAWAAVVAAGIFATLPFAGVLAETFQDQDVAAIGFVAAMALAAAMVLVQGLRSRPGGAEVGVALGVAAVYLMLLLRTTLPERTHLIEYSVLAVLVFEALAERRASGARVPAPWLLAMVATAAVGAVDEGIQYLMPSRVFDPLDLVFNTGAAVMAVVGMLALGAARTRRERRRDTA